MFYVGQKVVAIENSRNGYFIKGNDYIVEDLIACECGCVYLCIGVKCDIPMHEQNCECVNCKRKYPPQKYRFHDSAYFAPLETYRESYSIAIELVQQMEQVDKQKIFNPKKETV